MDKGFMVELRGIQFRKWVLSSSSTVITLLTLKKLPRITISEGIILRLFHVVVKSSPLIWRMNVFENMTSEIFEPKKDVSKLSERFIILHNEEIWFTQVTLY
jgi:hypothetical protein